MDTVMQIISPERPRPEDYNDLDFWVDPEKAGWLSKQGEYFKFWRRRWFVLKQGRLLWFKSPSDVTSTAVPRGVIQGHQCRTVNGADDTINKRFSIRLDINGWPRYYLAESEEEKQEWIKSINRLICQSSGAIGN